MNKNYQEYLKTDHWKYLRSRKHNTRCAICATSYKLDTHHLNYKKLFDVTTADLIKLCNRCHFLAHNLLKEGKLRFRNENPMSRYVLLKTAVKKYLGISGKNMFTDV
jgi:hypothetical protein